MPTATRTGMTPVVIEEMVEQRVTEALEAYWNRKPIREHEDRGEDDNGNGNGDGGINAYIQRFQELVLLCTKIVPEEVDQVKKFIGGLPDKIQGNNHRNKSRNKPNKARGRVYALGGGGANPDANVFMSTLLLNNHYACMLFDLDADRSFLSTTFSALLDIVPSTLDVSYVIELADEMIEKMNTLLRGCTVGLLGHPFDIDLMPVELGIFDVIIGKD
nr:reverse transcriptase domain-containing protein [Tanacetum cinerariifolium]